MSRRWWKRTVELAKFIEANFFNKGVYDVPFDDIVIEWKRAHGVPLAEAASHIERHVSAAGDYLREQGWYITNVTDAFFTTYGATIPKSDDDLRMCIPGLAGPDWPTAGWHVRNNDNTELAIMAYFRDLNSGNGKVKKAAEAMADAINAGEANAESVNDRNIEAGLPTTMAQMRRVKKAAEPPKAVGS